MKLDPVTLIAEVALLDTVLAVLMLLYGRQRRAFPGFGQWTGSAVAFAFAHGMLLARLVLPLSLCVLAASAAFCVGIQLRLDGTRRFCGWEGFPRLAYVLPVLVGGGIVGIEWAWASDVLRNTVTSLYVTVGAIACTWACFTASGTGRILFRIAGVSQAITSAAILARIGYWWTMPESHLLDHVSFQGYFFCIVSVNEVCLAATFILLNTLRVEQELAQSHGRLEEALSELESTMAGLKILRGFLSICSYCKNIRVTEDQWEAVESYVHRHSEADFSHGICPKCLTEHFPDFAQRVLKAPGPLPGDARENETE